MQDPQLGHPRHPHHAQASVFSQAALQIPLWWCVFLPVYPTHAFESFIGYVSAKNHPGHSSSRSSPTAPLRITTFIYPLRLHHTPSPCRRICRRLAATAPSSTSEIFPLGA